MENSIQGSCQCGKSQFTTTAKPLIRFICHCTICQSVYKAPYADATAIKTKNVTLANNNDIHFKKMRMPPAVRRGVCPYCDRPVVGYFNLSPLLPLALIPSANYSDDIVLPELRAHLFYNSRVADINDDVPKFSGYMASMWAISSMIITSSFFHKKPPE